MRNSSTAVRLFVVSVLAAVACAATSCSGTPSAVAPAPAVPGPAAAAPAPAQPQAVLKNGFIISMVPTSLTFLHATDPAQTIAFTVADTRILTVAVQDPTVASAVLNPGYVTLPRGGGFQETITVTTLNPGVTNLFISSKQGIVATVPIDTYGPLLANGVNGNTIQCHGPDTCTATNTLGGASVNFNEAFYPNSYSLTTDICQTANGVTTEALGGTYQLQLTANGYTQLVNAAIAQNSLTESVTCNTTVGATGSVPTTETFTVQFQTLQRGSGL